MSSLFDPVAIAGVARAVSAPVDILREYIETVLEPLLTAYTEVPSFVIATPIGEVPEGIVGVVNAEIELE